MIIKHRGISPQIDSSAYIAPTAIVIGKVIIAAKSKIMFGAIINSEGSRVSIGIDTVMSENAVVRATASGDVNHEVRIGDNVFIGPQTTILGATLESCTYIATGATVLQGAVIGSGSVVAVGGVVHANAVIPKDYFIPPYMVAIGDPVVLYSQNEKDEMSKAIMGVGFSKTAFGIDSSKKTRAQIYKEATLVRSEEYESHLSDEIIE